VQRIARMVGSDWDLVGESVGFFKASADAAKIMKRVLDAEVAAGRLDQEHEDALNVALAETAFGHERVDQWDWTEIDFPEDVERATEIATAIDS
jgi:choline kinase